MKFLYIKIVMFIMFMILSVQAQNSLSGKISDQSGNPLSSVNIIVTELQRGIISDADGTYLLSNLPNGKLNIQFSYVGCKTLIEIVEISNENTELNVSLQPAKLETSEIVVIGNTITKSEKAPYKIESISSEEMKRNGQVTLTQSLVSLPGINMFSNGLGISKPVIRGLSGYRIATILNGVRFDNQQWQEEHGFGIDEVGIDHIEIIEGPAALIYGAEALGGVINILPEKNAPVGRTLGEYNLKIFSNTLGAYSSAGFKGAGERLSWQLHLGGQTHADYLDGKDEKIPNTRFATLNAAGMLGYFYDWGFSNLEYTFAHDVYGVVEAGELNNPKDKEEDHFEREFEGPHHTIDYHIISLKNIFFAGNSKFKLDLGFQNNTRAEEEGADEQVITFNKVKASQQEGDMGELEMVLNTFTSNLEWIYQLPGNLEWTLGAQSTIQNNENEGERILIPNADFKELSGFTYLKLNYDNLYIESGLRYDHKSIETERMFGTVFSAEMLPIDNEYSVVNGAIGASYSFSDNIIGKINFASGFRAPNLAELSSNGVHEGTVRYEIGNSVLESERNMQIDAGMNFQSGSMNANLSYFYNKVNNFIYLNPTSAFINSYRIYRFVQDNSVLKGGEVSINYKPTDNVNITASYSSVAGKKENDTYLPFMPADKILAKAELNLEDWSVFYNFSIFAGVSHYLEQTKTATEELPSDAYTIVDAGINTSFTVFGKAVNTSLVVTNLLGEYYTDHLSLLKPLGVHGIGRNISLSMNIPFNLN